jgi:iron complex outermembrane receptor protein
MTKQLVFLKLILIVFISFTFQTALAQTKSKNTIPLAALLNKISNTHEIFFTYNANLLLNKKIQEAGFRNLSLKASISLLEKLTPFLFDDLGNNYFVIYSKEEVAKKKLLSQGTTFFSKDAIIDSTFNNNQIIVRGIVLSSDNTPLIGAALQEKESLTGITTNRDGTFEFKVQNNNTIAISFLGHESKILNLKPNVFHSIVLLSGEELDEVQVVGSRNKKRVDNDTPVAIDFINIEDTSSKSSQVEINQFLQYAIPSFNATKQSGADGADHIDPATIRGLGPDQT